MPDAIQTTTTDALAMLREDHKKIRALFAQYEGADEDAREGIVDNGVAEIEIHTLLEEEMVYPVVRRLGEDESIVDRAEEAHLEFIRIAEYLQEGMTIEQYDSLFRRLASQFMAHMDDEEATIFPVLEKMGAEELVGIGQKMLERREEALTELQEHGPQAPASIGETK